MYVKFVDHFQSLKIKYPKAKLVVKETSPFMKFIFKWSLMKYWCPDFMAYTTTIGYTIYMPKKYIGTKTGWIINLHEEIHQAQFHKWGYLFSASYLALLPVGLTMRAYWEWQAWKVTLQAHMDINKRITPEMERHIVDQFVGSTYFYMFPFRKTMTKLVRNEAQRIREAAAMAILK